MKFEICSCGINSCIFTSTYQDNYDWRILECLTPSGEIPSQQSFESQWMFSPLEARSYSVSFEIMLHYFMLQWILFLCCLLYTGWEKYLSLKIKCFFLFCRFVMQLPIYLHVSYDIVIDLSLFDWCVNM